MPILCRIDIYEVMNNYIVCCCSDMNREETSSFLDVTTVLYA